MQRFTDQRSDTDADELWVVEHDPVFTLGQAGKDEHVLAPGDIPVLHVDRGGQVTYHGPGQIVVYPPLRLPRLGIGVRDYVCRIEQAIIDTLAEWNIGAERREGARASMSAAPRSPRSASACAAAAPSTAWPSTWPWTWNPSTASTPVAIRGCR
jgi:lipoate-protein ligase B